MIVTRIVNLGFLLSWFYGGLSLIAAVAYHRYAPGQFPNHVTGCLMWAALLGAMTFGFLELRKVVLQNYARDAAQPHWIEPKVKPAPRSQITEFEIV